MSKTARRILVTAAVCVFAALIVWTVFYGNTRGANSGNPSAANPPPAQPAPASPPSSQAAATTSPGVGATQPAVIPPGAATGPATLPSITTAPSTQLGSLRAIAAGNDLGPRAQPPRDLGSIDPRRNVIHVQLSRFGAGIERIEFADLWQTALAKRQAERYLKSLAPRDPIDESKLPKDLRYVLVTRSPSEVFDEKAQLWLYSQVPLLALRSVLINGAPVDMLNDDSWSETAPGVFESRIVNAAGEDIARVMRRYHLGGSDNYDIAVEQRIVNLTTMPLEIRWQQYGPVDLPEDTTGYIPRRRLHYGYLPDPKNRPQLVLAGDKTVIERSSAIKQYQKSTQVPTPQEAQQLRTLWPNDEGRANGWGLSWFAATNRYFGLALHPPIAGDKPAAFAIGNVIDSVEIGVSNPGNAASETLFTTLLSPPITLSPGAEQSFDVGVFAGPLDRHVLGAGAYQSFSMTGMIIYSMGSCCSFLTFQWLAHLLLWFVSFLHDYVFFDWGLAIIGLVIVVRTLLHPLTKKSQVNMQRFGKRMQALKPELDKLQKKYANDKQKFQQEQLKLMREHGVNPLHVLGCLPLFLQMPIWIALWATLYLAFDLRQQPAFYGIFQMFGNWPFLSDLSSQDSFIPLGGGFVIPLVGWTVTSINLLPILMGIVFFIQQKYLTPPTTATMTPEQKQQQAIMKWMTVVLFPLMMYKSPSGLTLYIMTSSIIGILEGRYVRRHIDEIEKNLQAAGAGGAGGGGGGGGFDKPAKPKGALGRAWAERLQALREKAQQRQQEQRSFKKRK